MQTTTPGTSTPRSRDDWPAETTPLVDYLREVGRPAPAADSEAGSMVGTIALVSANKR